MTPECNLRLQAVVHVKLYIFLFVDNLFHRMSIGARGHSVANIFVNSDTNEAKQVDRKE